MPPPSRRGVHPLCCRERCQGSCPAPREHAARHPDRHMPACRPRPARHACLLQQAAAVRIEDVRGMCAVAGSRACGLRSQRGPWARHRRLRHKPADAPTFTASRCRLPSPGSRVARRRARRERHSCAAPFELCKPYHAARQTSQASQLRFQKRPACHAQLPTAAHQGRSSAPRISTSPGGLPSGSTGKPRDWASTPLAGRDGPPKVSTPAARLPGPIPGRPRRYAHTPSTHKQVWGKPPLGRWQQQWQPRADTAVPGAPAPLTPPA